MNPVKYEMARMTWKEAKEAFDADKVFVLALGSMEEHGPHSVVGDYMAAEAAAKEIAKCSGSVMVPVIPLLRVLPGFPRHHLLLTQHHVRHHQGHL